MVSSTRRNLLPCILILTGAGPAIAQTPARRKRVGALVNGGPGSPTQPNPVIAQLRRNLADLGQRDGVEIVIDARYADGALDRMPSMAADLVANGADVIVAFGGPGTSAARAASRTVPIVAAIVADPVALGVAASIERPGGNVTGATSDDPDLPARQIELLRLLQPNLSRLGIMSDAAIPGQGSDGLAPIERVAVEASRAAGLVSEMVKIRGPAPDIGGAFDTLARVGADALMVLEVPAPFTFAARIADMALERRLPAIFWGAAADAGPLAAYGGSILDTWRPAAVLADRILRGANPAELPFERVARRTLTINTRVARRLGLVVPPDLLKRADRVID